MGVISLRSLNLQLGEENFILGDITAFALGAILLIQYPGLGFQRTKANNFCPRFFCRSRLLDFFPQSPLASSMSHYKVRSLSTSPADCFSAPWTKALKASSKRDSTESGGSSTRGASLRGASANPGQGNCLGHSHSLQPTSRILTLDRLSSSAPFKNLWYWHARN